MTLDPARALRAALASGDSGWRILLDENPQPVLVFAPGSLHIVAANGAATAFYGYTLEEFTALSLRDLWAPDAAGAVAELAEAPATRRTMGRYRHRHKNSAILQVDLVSHELPVAGERARLAVVADASERANLLAQLRQAQKMGALGQLASSVAHDFSNLLTVIMTTVDLAEAALEEDHAARGDLRVIAQATRRAAELTRQLLTLSRKRPPRAELIDLNVLIAGPVQLLRRLMNAGGELDVACEPGLWAVRSDAGQMEQVLLNLAVNARDAMPTGGTLTITTRNARVDGALAEGRGVAPGDYVSVTVRDTGIGMDAETLEHAFEPFFTTKPPGRGTGLGLSTVHGIVRQWGGQIHGESAPGAGTTFTVLLPRAE